MYLDIRFTLSDKQDFPVMDLVRKCSCLSKHYVADQGF